MFLKYSTNCSRIFCSRKLFSVYGNAGRKIKIWKIDDETFKLHEDYFRYAIGMACSHKTSEQTSRYFFNKQKFSLEGLPNTFAEQPALFGQGTTVIGNFEFGKSSPGKWVLIWFTRRQWTSKSAGLSWNSRALNLFLSLNTSKRPCMLSWKSSFQPYRDT